MLAFILLTSLAVVIISRHAEGDSRLAHTDNQCERRQPMTSENSFIIKCLRIPPEEIAYLDLYLHRHHHSEVPSIVLKVLEMSKN